MSPNRSLLKHVVQNKLGSIVTASGKTAEMEGIGQASVELVRGRVDIGRVLYVPSLKVNLLSISEMVKQGNVVVFDKTGCVIKNDNGVMASVTPDNGVYMLSQATLDRGLVCVQNDAMMWHRKLGLAGLKTLQLMRNTKTGVVFGHDVDRIKNCSVCAEGKQARLPYQKSTTETPGVLELLHSDVMGPMET